jgi:hypothetical protein
MRNCGRWKVELELEIRNEELEIVEGERWN